MPIKTDIKQCQIDHYFLGHIICVAYILCVCYLPINCYPPPIHTYDQKNYTFEIAHQCTEALFCCWYAYWDSLVIYSVCSISLHCFSPDSTHLRLRFSDIKRMLICKSEYSCVKACYKLDKILTESLIILQEAYGEECMNHMQCYDWYQYFKSGRTSTEDVVATLGSC